MRCQVCRSWMGLRSNGFALSMWRVKFTDGSESMGIVASETADEIVLNVPGGSPITLPRTKIKVKGANDKSLMPFLAGSMTEQELVYVVEYLSSLKR